MCPILVWLGAVARTFRTYIYQFSSCQSKRICSDANIRCDSVNDWWWCNDETRFLESTLRRSDEHIQIIALHHCSPLLAKQFVSRVVPFNILRLVFFSLLVSENNKKSIALPALRFSLNLILLHTASTLCMNSLENTLDQKAKSNILFSLINSANISWHLLGKNYSQNEKKMLINDCILFFPFIHYGISMA